MCKRHNTIFDASTGVYRGALHRAQRTLLDKGLPIFGWHVKGGRKFEHRKNCQLCGASLMYEFTIKHEAAGDATFTVGSECVTPLTAPGITLRVKYKHRLLEEKAKAGTLEEYERRKRAMLQAEVKKIRKRMGVPPLSGLLRAERRIAERIRAAEMQRQVRIANLKLRKDDILSEMEAMRDMSEDLETVMSRVVKGGKCVDSLKSFVVSLPRTEKQPLRLTMKATHILLSLRAGIDSTMHVFRRSLDRGRSIDDVAIKLATRWEKIQTDLCAIEQELETA